MEKLQIEKANAVKAFNATDSTGKKLLSDLFGDNVFAQKITDRVKSFVDACYVLNINPNRSKFTDGDKDSIAYEKLKVIAKALNEGWTPDWDDEDEYKYYPWFYADGEFRLYYVHYYYAITTVGSRLCFKSRELAEYAAKQFLSLYKDYLSNK